MGNFSRNTFDPAKTYVAVRLQQGVPLVDADWNELQDVTRHELYDGLSLLLSQALQPSGMGLTGAGANDLALSPGTAVVAGRPIRVPAGIRYTTQRYVNAATAAADGVQVVPPLTTPTANRSDAAFLDVFEREVRSSEDGNLVNPAIGVETAVRLRREVVLRVAEGATSPPAPPPGHAFVHLAQIQRFANQANIGPFAIEELLPRVKPVSSQDMAVPPLFQPVTGSGFGSWATSFGSNQNQLVASKAVNNSALGIAPLSFPNGARLRSLRIRGQNPAGGGLLVHARRIRLDTGAFEDISPVVVVGSGAFDRTFGFELEFNKNIVNNTFFSYVLQASASVSAGVVELFGVTINYMP